MARGLFLVRVAAWALGCFTVSGASAAIISDFETGTTEGWTANDGTVVLAPAVGGSGGSGFALQVTRTGGGWNNTMSLALAAAQWTDVAAGTVFTIDVKAQGGTEVPGWWLQAFPILNSAAGGWNQAGSAVGGTLDGQWHTYTWTYPSQPADPGAYSQLFLASQGGGDPTMTFYLDNIGIVPIPEPTSFALVVVAAAPLLGGRRCAGQVGGRADRHDAGRR